MNPFSSISAKTRNRLRAGFTLIEVLAALFVAGLAVTIILPFMTQLIAKAWSGESNLASADEWMQASARLTADLSEAVPISESVEDVDLLFHATARRIEFVRRSLVSGHKALELVTFAIESNGHSNILLRSTRPYSKNQNEGEVVTDNDQTRISLLKSPYGLHFKIRNDEREIRSPDDNRQLPYGVELDVDSGGTLPDVPFFFPIVARTHPSAAIPPKNNK